MNNDYNNNNWQYNGFQPQPQGPQPGQGPATGSLVCGIISLVAAIVFGWTAFLSLAGLVVGIIGIVLAVNAKKQGNTSGTQTAGLVLSIIGACLSGIIFISCVACICISGALVDGYDPSDLEAFLEGIDA